MTIEFVLDISKNEDLLIDMEGQDELDLKVECDPYFEGAELMDIEIGEIGIYNGRSWVFVEGELEQEILKALEYSDKFAQAIYAQAEEERASNELERRIQQAEDKRDRIDEARCWAGQSN